MPECVSSFLGHSECCRLRRRLPFSAGVPVAVGPPLKRRSSCTSQCSRIEIIDLCPGCTCPIRTIRCGWPGNREAPSGTVEPRIRTYAVRTIYVDAAGAARRSHHPRIPKSISEIDEIGAVRWGFRRGAGGNARRTEEQQRTYGAESDREANAGARAAGFGGHHVGLPCLQRTQTRCTVSSQAGINSGKRANLFGPLAPTPVDALGRQRSCHPCCGVDTVLGLDASRSRSAVAGMFNARADERQSPTAATIAAWICESSTAVHRLAVAAAQRRRPFTASPGRCSRVDVPDGLNRPGSDGDSGYWISASGWSVRSIDPCFELCGGASASER
jgi:hypothetical protein